MKILSMTATFGKLEHDTLTFQPGLNIIEAPNEWGKSTWCAFLVAMLYGIETRVHTTKTALADKERFAPWSGSPMSGRIDLDWNGRAVTIERRSKGRSIFGVFRAYETDTGLDIPELTAANCGQMLLGVEKSVFLRAGFLRLADLPVAQDETLRRRLNSIVTTGDESGTADILAQKLRDLKNRCRLNRSTGLLPQLEAQRRELEATLSDLRELQAQSLRIHQRQQQLQKHHSELENHKAALQYAQSRTHREDLAAAETALKQASAREAQLQLNCAGLAPMEEVEHTALRLRQLRDSRDALHLEAQMLPPAPRAPEISPVFRNTSPEAAVSQAVQDAQLYADNTRRRPFPWYYLLLLILGAAALLIPHWAGKAAGALLAAAGILLLSLWGAANRRRAAQSQALAQRYLPIQPEDWVSAARQYAGDMEHYHTELEAANAERVRLETRLQELNQQINAVTQGHSLAECEQRCTAARDLLSAYAAACKDRKHAEQIVQSLRGHREDAPAPLFPDTMTHSAQDTDRLLSDCAFEQRQLDQKLGQVQGQMSALGREDALLQQLDALNLRIAKLEDTYAALELAQTTLAAASAELQRRFAPRISRRAQEIFSQLTDGRYTRLTLGEDLTVHAAAEQEDTLCSALWRSEGTVDQLYLALRLAMAEALTPDAPLILDDALCRFDDNRLQAAIALLAEEARSKQVIIFSCQQRESAAAKKIQ